MEIKIQGLSEIFEIIGSLYKGVKAAAEIPETAQKEMNEALADTAELIDETLTILKQHLSSVIAELKFGDEDKARLMILNLANFQEWEQKYRRFELCDTLRGAVISLDKKGLFKLKNKVSFGDMDKLQQLIWDYIGGEVNAARSVGEMLVNLAKLSDFDPAKKDAVIASLDKARVEIHSWREKFMDMEKKIRSAVI